MTSRSGSSPGQGDPTDTDASFQKWIHTNEIYYEILTDDEDSVADIYGSAQKTHVAKRLAQQVASCSTSSRRTTRSADVLALFVSDDPAGRRGSAGSTPPSRRRWTPDSRPSPSTTA